MRTRTRSTVVLLAASSALGCTQILGVEDIPNDSGADASQREAGGSDVTVHDGGHDALRPDSGVDASAPCTGGATRCAADGLGFETCSDAGVWGPAGRCPEGAPVCLSGRCVCAPGITRCEGQQFETCVAAPDAGGDAFLPDAGYPTWALVGAPCPGTCSLAGCGPALPSCGAVDGGLDLCTASGAALESCCTTGEVPGGSFFLSYDGISTGLRTQTYPETVSPFRLDRFEVTVGRFTAFVAALGGANPWVPEIGSGKHVHVNGGKGLVDQRASSEAGVVYEQGWDGTGDSDLHALGDDPTELLACGNLGTYGADPSLPINCVTWAEAYAFCIWDGGFLPSEAEWNFAAAGGDQQRYFPWSAALDPNNPPRTPPIATCNNANFTASGDAGPCEPVSYQPSIAPAGYSSVNADGGNARWGHADMAGNAVEWTLDYFWNGAPASCTDCARTDPAPLDGGPVEAGAALRVQRGGSFVSDSLGIRTAPRGSNPQDNRSYVNGFRCARPP